MSDDKHITTLLSDQTVLKIDKDQRIVWGWASVSTLKGKVLVDLHDEVISTDEMVKAANKFMLNVRAAKAMHTGDQIGEVIHSLPLTKELGESLGIQCEYEGWIIAMKIHDDEIWEKVKTGEFSAFSIGGRAKRHAR